MNNTIPRDPATWTLDDARATFAPAQRPEIGAGLALEYLLGDHWQDGGPWMGIGRDPGGDWSSANLKLVRQNFVPVPESAGCVRERINGACGNQPDISIAPLEPAGKGENGEPVPSADQEQYARQWATDITKWWDRRKLWGGMDVQKPMGVRGAVAYASAHPSGGSHSGSCIRAYFNPASRVDSAADGSRRIPRQRDRLAALDHIQVSAPSPDRCTVYTDPDTGQETGIFLFEDEQGNEHAEICFSRAEGGRTVTTVRTVGEGGVVKEEADFPFGGLLPIQLIDIGTLLTKPVRGLQASIDFHATALKRLTEAHGFGLRTEINAADDGEWKLTPPPGVDLPRTKVLEDGRTAYLNPTTPGLGNQSIRKLRGFEYDTSVTAEERVSSNLTTPGVHYHEPSDPETVIKALDANIMLFREACHQGHRTSGLLGSTAEASGDAYEQARAAFEADVKSVAEAVDAALIPFLAVVTMMADWLTDMDDPSVFPSEWAVKVQSHPSAGPVSNERQQTTLQLVQGGLISEDEGTARVGVQDVQAERDRIAAAQSLNMLDKRAEVAKKLRDGGADAKAAYIVAGFSEEEADMLSRSDGEPFVDQ